MTRIRRNPAPNVVLSISKIAATGVVLPPNTARGQGRIDQNVVPGRSSFAPVIIGAVLLGMNGCADIQKIGFVPWSQAAARFQQAYNACHEDKACREKAWADYHAELAALSSEDGLNPDSPDKATILSSFDKRLK